MPQSRFAIKRVYERRSGADGYRVLVDALWPRGVAKKDAAIDLWLKEVAPSDELRRWFAHDPIRWTEFRTRYFRELDGRKGCLESLVERAQRGRVTLIYGAKEDRCNNAAALKEYLERRAPAAVPRYRRKHS